MYSEYRDVAAGISNASLTPEACRLLGCVAGDFHSRGSNIERDRPRNEADQDVPTQSPDAVLDALEPLELDTTCKLRIFSAGRVGPFWAILSKLGEQGDVRTTTPEPRRAIWIERSPLYHNLTAILRKSRWVELHRARSPSKARKGTRRAVRDLKPRFESNLHTHHIERYVETGSKPRRLRRGECHSRNEDSAANTGRQKSTTSVSD